MPSDLPRAHSLSPVLSLQHVGMSWHSLRNRQANRGTAHGRSLWRNKLAGGARGLPDAAPRGDRLAGSVHFQPNPSLLLTPFLYPLVHPSAPTTSHMPALSSSLLSKGHCGERSATGLPPTSRPRAGLSRPLTVRPSPPRLPSQSPALLCTGAASSLTTSSAGLTLESLQVPQPLQNCLDRDCNPGVQVGQIWASVPTLPLTGSASTLWALAAPSALDQ